MVGQLLLVALATWLGSVDGDIRPAPAYSAGGPCASGDWGYIRTPALGTLHVRANGNDRTGDGSLARPFASVERAVDEARTRLPDERWIAVGPGTFKTSLSLDSAQDDGLMIQGCGPQETILRGWGQQHVVDVSTNIAVELTGLGLRQGAYTLTLRDGANVVVDAVDIDQAKQRALRVEGADTLAMLQNVNVSTVLKASSCGWGVDVRDAMLLWFGGSVEDTRALGIFADNADLVLDDVFVKDTRVHSDGTLGRGLHAQRSFTVVTDSVFQGNHDAALFLLDPRGGVISRIVIDQPGAGIVKPGGPTTGDGIVVRGQGGTEVVHLVDNYVEDAPRAALLLDDMRAALQGNTGFGTGLFPLYGAHAFRQGLAQVAGPDAPGVLDISASPEPINDDYLVCTN